MKIQTFPLLLCLLLALAPGQARPQDSGTMQQQKQYTAPTLAQRVQYMLIARELPWSTPDSDMQVFDTSRLDAIGELREALLLSRLKRYSDPQQRREYLEKQFLPYLERQDEALRASGEVRFLHAAALLELGRLDEALAIASTLPTESTEDGSGYALWGIVLLEQGQQAEAGKVLEAGRKFYTGNELLLVEYYRQRLAGGAMMAEREFDEYRNFGNGVIDKHGPDSAYVWLAQARLMAEPSLEAGLPDLAADASETVLSFYPEDVEMLSVAARAAALRRQFNIAAKHQVKLCTLQPTAANWVQLGNYYSEAGDGKAGEAFGEALRLAPGDTAALKARAAWHERGGNREAAIADLRKLLEADPQDREAARSLARLQVASESTGSGGAAASEGEAQLYELIRTDPSPAAYLDLLEIIQADPLRRQEYENVYNDMLARFRNDPAVVLNYAQRLLAEQKYTAALEQFQRGEGLDPVDAAFPLGIGDCLMQMGGISEARSAYERSLRLAYDPLAVAGLARSLDELGEGELAERSFRDQLNSRPQDSELVMQYGLFLFERTQYTAAFEQYQLGQRLDPDNEMFVNRAALCLFMLNQIPEAISMLKDAIRIRPRPLFYRNLAIAYEEDAELEQAEQYYREGLELFPGDPKLLEGYSEFLEQQGRSGEALSVLEQSAQGSTDKEVLMDLATLAQSAGRNQLARDTYRRALQVDPFDLVVNERYSTFLAMQDDNSGLLAHLEQAIPLLDELDFDELAGTLTGFWIEQDRTDDGMLILSQLIEFHPTIVRLYNSLALMQHLADDNETALTTVRRGQRYAGESFLGLYLETLISWRHLGVEEALPLGARLIEHPEADAKSWLLYLDMLGRSGNTQEEASVAARGLKRFLGNEQLYAHLVRATRASGDIRELIRVLEDPVYVRIRNEQRALLLGESYVAVGNYPRALASLQPLLEADAFNTDALQLSGEANFMLGEQQLAREQLTTALAINPEHAPSSLWLGWVLLEDGDLAGAEQSFASAEKSPALGQVDLAWTRLGQARVAIRRGERKQAAELLQQAEALGGGDERFDSYLPQVRSEIQPGG